MRVCLGDQVCTVILPSYTQLEGATQRMTVTQMPFSTALLTWAWHVLSNDWILTLNQQNLEKTDYFKILSSQKRASGAGVGRKHVPHLEGKLAMKVRRQLAQPFPS